MIRLFSLVFAAIILISPISEAQAGGEAIRFGILPVLDTLPLQVAQKDGLFKEVGLEVELIPFSSALERDTAMQTGQLDGYFGDLINTLLLIQGGANMRIGLVSYRTTPDRRMFGIAASPGNSDMSAEELSDASIGISESTVIEFLLDRMETANFTKPHVFKRVEVKKIPLRLQMLLSDQLDLALLPEPLLSLTEFKGGRVLFVDDELDLPLTVLCLDEQYFKDNGRIYKAFIAAYDQAVARINANPDNYRKLMAEKCRIPAPLAEKFPVYEYPTSSLPTPEEIDLVQDWMLDKGMLKAKIDYSRTIAPQ